MGIFDLTSEQQKAFNRLKKAYKDCEKTGIFFYNNYGSLGAVDKNKIDGYGDETISSFKNELIYDDSRRLNTISIANEWADDTHYFHLTKKG